MNFPLLGFQVQSFARIVMIRNAIVSGLTLQNRSATGLKRIGLILLEAGFNGTVAITGVVATMTMIDRLSAGVL